MIILFTRALKRFFPKLDYPRGELEDLFKPNTKAGRSLFRFMMQVIFYQHIGAHHPEKVLRALLNLSADREVTRFDNCFHVLGDSSPEERQLFLKALKCGVCIPLGALEFAHVRKQIHALRVQKLHTMAQKQTYAARGMAYVWDMALRMAFPRSDYRLTQLQKLFDSNSTEGRSFVRFMVRVMSYIYLAGRDPEYVLRALLSIEPTRIELKICDRFNALEESSSVARRLFLSALRHGVSVPLDALEPHDASSASVKMQVRCLEWAFAHARNARKVDALESCFDGRRRAISEHTYPPFLFDAIRDIFHVSGVWFFPEDLRYTAQCPEMLTALVDFACALPGAGRKRSFPVRQTFFRTFCGVLEQSFSAVYKQNQEFQLSVANLKFVRSYYEAVLSHVSLP